MGVKKLIRRAAKFILESSPEKHVIVEVAQINYGGILKEKKIVVTGGGRGIGFEMARKFLSEGARVVIAGRKEETLKKAVAELGSNCQYLVFDMTEFISAKKFLEQARNLMGGLNCLVCNAGISLHEGNIKNVTLDGWDQTFNTNLKGSYFLAQAYLELIEHDKTDKSSLLFISSETGNQCYDIPYGLTKVAINSLTGALSRRRYQDGVRVNAIAPGVTLSDMTKEYAEASDGNMYRSCASGRIFRPEEVAEVACFLLSDASMCVSGQIIHCNAGNHLKTFWDESK